RRAQAHPGRSVSQGHRDSHGEPRHAGPSRGGAARARNARPRRSGSRRRRQAAAAAGAARHTGAPRARAGEGARARARSGARAGQSAAGARRGVKVTALAAHTPEAVRAALAARGWESQASWFAATGVQPVAVLLEDIDESQREGLVHWSTRAGADVLTGDGWALIATAASRLAPLAR